jgi:hypothetical protein
LEAFVDFDMDLLDLCFFIFFSPELFVPLLA